VAEGNAASPAIADRPGTAAPVAPGAPGGGVAPDPTWAAGTGPRDPGTGLLAWLDPPGDVFALAIGSMRDWRLAGSGGVDRFLLPTPGTSCSLPTDRAPG
jgi:hypothetical protein